MSNFSLLINEEKQVFGKNEKRKRIDYEENPLVCKIEKRRRTADFQRRNPGTGYKSNTIINDIYGGGSTFSDGYGGGSTFSDGYGGGSTFSDGYGGGSTFSDGYGGGSTF
jgi:hypothetical protein